MEEHVKRHGSLKRERELVESKKFALNPKIAIQGEWMSAMLN